MQRTRDAGAVVVPKRADARDDVLDVLRRHLVGAEEDFPAGEARLRFTPQVEHDLQQLLQVVELVDRLTNVWRQGAE